MKRFASPAGGRRTRITVERLKSNATIDAAGLVDESDDDNWETYCSRWASIRYLRGSENFVGDQLQANSGIEVRIDSDATSRAIDQSMRITFSDRTLGIAEPPVDNNQERREVVIRCIEVKR